MNPARWKQLARGDGCPFDAPRSTSNDHWDLVEPLSASSLYLSTNQTYRGHCLLIFDLRHAVRIGQLRTDEWTVFCHDLHRAERAIERTVKPDHMNVAALGNVVPHLHWHIIPRYRDDPRWGAPIWPTALADLPHRALAAVERLELIQSIRATLLASDD